MTFDDIKGLGPLLDVAQTVAVVVLWLRKPGQDATAKVDALARRMDVIDERLKHVPSNSDMAELEGTVKAMSATLEAIQESQDMTRGTVARIEQYLLDSKK